MRTLLAVVLTASLGLSLPFPAQRLVARPKILGVAHLAVFVSDLPKARAFYEGLLGFEEPFTLPKPDGTVEIAFVKINDRQWIELFNRPSAGEGQLNHIAIYTDDADGMRDYLASQGVAVPERVAKGRTGNKNFMVKDPDGHNVEIVEYQPDSWTGKDAGAHVPASRMSRACPARRHPGWQPRGRDEVLRRHPRLPGVLARQRRQFEDAQLGQHARPRRNGLHRVHAATTRSPRQTSVARRTTSASSCRMRTRPLRR